MRDNRLRRYGHVTHRKEDHMIKLSWLQKKGKRSGGHPPIIQMRTASRDMFKIGITPGMTQNWSEYKQRYRPTLSPGLTFSYHDLESSPEDLLKNPRNATPPRDTRTDTNRPPTTLRRAAGERARALTPLMAASQLDDTYCRC
ncbi:hypothetical protein EVAR_54069_1 [Eumeta japonica]|uniref:Uncharacterized protein n=1 Tax=Eumeta variegata TaxID=151549 RepID=A0A4C1XHS9_EUMVA|nr:hypothetical protein EVAR_54069_1 [Eumeta japonica]